MSFVHVKGVNQGENESLDASLTFVTCTLTLTDNLPALAIQVVCLLYMDVGKAQYQIFSR
jgi:hypothetical protein